MLASNVKVIQPKVKTFEEDLRLPQYTRVAGYARVSTGRPEQKTSFESQQKDYQKILSKHPDWVDIGLYADEGITGTSIRKRKNFIRMIEDCRAGKIDKIIVKSVSRFARNTVDCLATIEELTALGVEVYFVLQNLSSIKDSKTTKLQLTLFASMAQEESETLSESVAYGIRMGIESGRYKKPKAYGYYVDENKDLKINQEQAENVKMIFKMFLEGYTAGQICKWLNDNGIEGPKGKYWYETTLINLLRNEKYIGDLRLEKTVSTDLKTRRRVPNTNGNQFYVNNHHEPIISKELFDRVQREFEYRESLRGFGKTGKAQYTSQYAFSNKLFCGNCGAKYRRHRYETKNKQTGGIDYIHTWVCVNHKLNGNKACMERQIKEETLKSAFVAALNSLIEEKQDFMDTIVENINSVLETDLSIVAIEELKQNYLKKQRELQGIMNKSITAHDSEITASYEALMGELEQLKEQIKKAEFGRISATMHSERSNEMKKFLQDKEPFAKFDDNVFRKLVQKAIIKEDEVSFVFSDYLERTVPLVR